MSDRLEELRRQRELHRGQLERLDREIAALEAAAPPEAQPPLLVEPGQDKGADEILDQFRQEPSAIIRQTKLGCIAYFAAAMALLALLALAYWLRASSGRAHP